jgi:predicted CxxxxCH...CXXCH cytochrome family protein
MRGIALRFVVLAAGILACAQASAATLTVTARSGGNGASGQVVSTTPPIACSVGGTSGCTATITTPATFTLGYVAGANSLPPAWAGCSSIVSGNCVVTMTGNRSVTATFPPATWGLTVRPSGSSGATGTITASPQTSPDAVNCNTPGPCTSSIASSAVVNLVATPGTGSAFTGWAGACSGTGACSVTMSAARTVTATFARASYPVSVAFSGGTGTVTSTGGVAPNLSCTTPGTGICSGTLLAGGTMLLTAAANAMSDFTGWSGCTSVAGSVCTVSGLIAGRQVTASFQAKACTSCHGVPPAAPHMQNLNCGMCHQGYTNQSVNAATHLNGQLDVSFVCGGCHAVPPEDSAHVIHSGAPVFPPTMGYGEVTILEDYSPTAFTATEYKFGCGQCHPMAAAKHMDGNVDVEVSSLGAPAGSLRAMNDVGASYSGTIGQRSGSCYGVACHSSGQATPIYKSSPAWNTTTPIACDACHANPPRYANGGEGSATANTHVVAGDDGYAVGHFGGFHGPWGNSYHGYTMGAGGYDSAPITCQTCHYRSVDPANTGPSGFYYFDTTGNYSVNDPISGQPSIIYDPVTGAGQVGNEACRNCHTGAAGAAPQGIGRALALRHVNGRREVDFDPRSSAGTLAGYPGAPSGPNLKPYWWSGIGRPGQFWNGAVYENGTWSADLLSATYEPATKTCTNVACHIQESNTAFPALPPLRWGKSPVGWSTCDACHGYGRP